MNRAVGRLRRACLSVPGGSARLLAKAPAIAVDMAFVDLEDSVPAQAKTQARRAAVEALEGTTWRASTVGVRINAVGTAWWKDDVAAVVTAAGPSVDTLVVPKVESADDVRAIDGLLSEFEERGRAEQIGIEAQIETARGMLEVEQIATASGRMETLVFGPSDYAASLGVVQETIGRPDPRYPGDQWHYARARIANVAHAVGLQPIDGPYAAFDDVEGLRATALHARLLGFEGKWVIHPEQIEPCTEFFSPTGTEIEWAQGVLDALERATAAGGGGAIVHAGVMADEASARVARRVLERAGRVA